MTNSNNSNHDSSKRQKKSESLCKRSTRIAANILRMSSLCLARISLLPLDAGKRRRYAAGAAKTSGPATSLDADAEAATPRGGRGVDKSSWEPQTSPVSHQLESPREEEKAQLVNRRATDYIAEIHRRNSRDADAAAEAAEFIPPPPRRPSIGYGF